MEKAIDLTFANYANKKANLTARNKAAEEYSVKVQGKLIRKEVRKMQITETILILLPMMYLIGRMLF